MSTYQVDFILVKSQFIVSIPLFVIVLFKTTPNDVVVGSVFQGYNPHSTFCIGQSYTNS